MLNFILDGTPVNEPIGFDQVEEHLYYSNDLSAYITEIDGNVTFTEDQYDYLRNIFNTNVCGSVTFRIYDSENQEIEFDGIINVSDITFYPEKKWAVCEIQNDNITGRIQNNQSILCNLTAGKTKNDNEYAVTQQTITIFDPTGVNSVTRKGIRIFDAFSSIITFLTDGEIGFVSDYFDYSTNTDPQVYSVLMTGSELRTGNGNSPTISFGDLFNDMNSLENLAIAFDNGNIRIEDKDYFKDQNSSISFNSIEEISQELATETLYAKVRFGSAKVLGTYDYLQDIRFNGMQNEEYHLGGQCNTDTELNLSCVALITDANAIQDTLPASGGMGGNDNDDYDDDVMIIHCNTSNAVLTPKPASITDFYFNDRFTNRNVALRWLGQIPQSIYAFLGNGNDGCYINQISDQFLGTFSGFQPTQETPPPWNDVNSNYVIDTRYLPNSELPEDSPDYPLFGQNVTAGFYTAPFNGVYSFEVDIIQDVANAWVIGRMKTDSLSVGSNGESYVLTSEPIGGGLYRVYGGASFYLNTNEYVGLTPLSSAWFFNVIQGSTFRCFDPLGGVWQTYDASTVFNIENQFEYPINVSDWKSIKNEPYKSMGINSQNVATSGWLKDISRNLKTGKAEITLLGRNG